MNKFDLSILTYLNSLVNKHPSVDALVVHFQYDSLLKAVVLMAGWWYCWFRPAAPDKKLTDHKRLIAGLLGMVVGILFARVLALILPFRIRPEANPVLHFVIPHWDGKTIDLIDWSAFPSDHAVLWFSIATAIFLVDKRFGLLTFIYACWLAVGRIYVGFHHPTDILAGAAIGIASVCVFNSRLSVRHIISPILRWSEAKPGAYYAAAFLCTYEISITFEDVRVLGSSALRLVFP